MTARMRTGLVAVGLVAAVAAVLVGTGALEQRDDERVPELAIGEEVETSRADVVVDAFGPGEEAGDVIVTITVVNHLPESLRIDDLVTLHDDEGLLARYGTTTISGGGGGSAAQPGVAETFATVYSPDRPAVGELRVEIEDATWTPRDETAFGIGSNMYDVRLAAIVRMP